VTRQRFRIRTEHDAAEATRAARELAVACGLGTTEAVALATAVSEVAINQVQHAGGGEVTLDAITAEPRPGVQVEALDHGAGMADVDLALQDGWSGAGGLGLGLPGARRLMDEFELDSAPGRGTRIRMAKWRRAGAGILDNRRLAAWATSGPSPGSAGFEPLVTRLPAGLLMAVARAADAARIRGDAALTPAALSERIGGRDAALARFEGLDGRLLWQAQPAAGGTLWRERRGRMALVASAPRHRSAAVPVLRGDLLLLASFTSLDPPPGETLAEIAEAVRASGPSGAVVLAARFERGSLERRA
jgi:serine/threonine-protein kinase RsbT